MLASRITHTHSRASRVGYISILGSPVNGGDPEGGVDRDTAKGAAGPRTPADPLRTRNGASATRPASVLHPIRAPVVGALPQPWSRRGGGIGGESGAIPWLPRTDEARNARVPGVRRFRPGARGRREGVQLEVM